MSDVAEWLVILAIAALAAVGLWVMWIWMDRK